ncbi:MAG: hypothetical protein QOG82_2833 [Actinomycetota bacterium]|jgi:hypothetical protein|nr:hypothetical protein [Actinomycetota bacterium]
MSLTTPTAQENYSSTVTPRRSGAADPVYESDWGRLAFASS